MRATVLVAVLLASPVAAQGPAFDSPGQSSYGTMGQTTRFSTEFNPAIGFVIDAFGDYLGVDNDSDGFNAELRLLEFNAAAYIDPDAWAYVVISSEELEGVEVEEAAVEYIGFDNNSTLKGGRFFVDFGKQMQQHLEELRTLERPLVLREYLGEELAGTGGQWDHWFAVGDSPVRFSVGVFADLLGEGHHEDEGEEEPETAVPERKDFDELSFSARVTGMRDVGESGILQLGASTRIVPEFTAEFGPLSQDGLSNVVYGGDITFGHTDETGNKRFTCGGEALLFDGDLSAEVDDPAAPTVLTVLDDDVFGFYGFADYAWNQQDSAGVQYSRIESPENPADDVSELDFYYTHHFTEFRRIRFGVTAIDAPMDGDALRAYVQLTGFFGSHAHGLNW